MRFVHGLFDYRLDEMRFSGQVDVMDSILHASSVRDVSLRPSLYSKRENRLTGRHIHPRSKMAQLC